MKHGTARFVGSALTLTVLVFGPLFCTLYFAFTEHYTAAVGASLLSVLGLTLGPTVTARVFFGKLYSS